MTDAYARYAHDELQITAMAEYATEMVSDERKAAIKAHFERIYEPWRPLFNDWLWVGFKGDKFKFQGTKEVDLAPFEIGLTEVTVAEYRKCVDAKACKKPDTALSCNCVKLGRDRHPVNRVSWEDANAYAAFVGGGARLPSKAEWEFAATSGGQEHHLPLG